MFSIRSVLALGVAAVLLAACDSATLDGKLVCGPTHRPTTHDLKFKLKATDDGCVEKVKKNNDNDGTSIEVCRGDSVRWKVKVNNSPSGDKKRRIAFKTKNQTIKSPFDWKDSGYKSGWIEGKVRADADSDTHYEYSVSTEGGPGNGCPLDPMIIVRH